MYKKIIYVTILILFIFLCSCSSQQSDYIEGLKIKVHKSGENTIRFNDYYIDIANEYYQIQNYNKINLYRYKDSAIAVFDFDNSVKYEDIYKAMQFFNQMFIVQRGATTVSVGSMSGFLKKIYDDDYKFWNDAYFICRINDRVVYEACYKENSADKLLLSDENIDFEYSNLFEIGEASIQRCSNLKKLNILGECKYYRSPIGNTLYIEIFTDSISDKELKKSIGIVEDTLTNLDEELIYYYNSSYPIIEIMFRDSEGIYYQKRYISNLKNGFKVLE